MMRPLRKKVSGENTALHCYNRISGAPDHYLFTDVDKEFAFKLLADLSRFYVLEVIAFTVLDNHYHIIVHVPSEFPSLTEAARRHNTYYGAKKIELNPDHHPEQCQKVAERMVDLSDFMRMFQQRFSCYINRVHRRRGSLWANRFKSTVLEGRSALWNCVKYLELNSVRAKMVDDPADYRFCSWGRYCGSGKHPFYDNFVKHMKRSWSWEDTSEWTGDEVFAAFRGELARVIASESGATAEEIHQAAEKARERGDSMPVRFLRRTRHWVDGGIIGSKAFVQEVACRYHDQDDVLKKQLSRGLGARGEVLHCFKRLRTT